MKNEILTRIKKLSPNEDLYLVGGWLRDSIIGKSNKDIDIAVKKDPKLLAKKCAKAFGGSFIELDENNRIYRVALKNDPNLTYIDFAAFRGSDIVGDLKKRDFTINALALKIGAPEEQVIDPTKGKIDLKKKIVKMTTAAVFKEDPLRLLRAFRIASQLGFTIDKKTLTEIKRNSQLIRKPAGERVRDELFKILSNPHSLGWINSLDAAGLLENILPEMLAMKKSARKFYFHPNGLWQHSVETLESLELIVSRIDKLFPKDHKKIMDHLSEPFSQGITRLSVLKLVCLLHDAAKPICAKRIGKKMRFLGHETKGAKMISDIMARLKMGRHEIKASKQLVTHHMRPVSLGQTHYLTARAFFRLYRNLKEDTVDLALLSLSDCYSYRRLKTRKAVELKIMKQITGEIIEKYFHEIEKPSLPKIIDGNILMKKLKLKPGPIVGKLLKTIYEAQVLGKITTQDEAIFLAARRLTRLKK